MYLRSLFLVGCLLVTSALCAQVVPPAVPAETPAKIETFLVPVRLTVAPDGSGEYRTVQEAVMAVRDFMQVTATIFIKNGTYHEKLLVPLQKTNITLLGESREGVVSPLATIPAMPRSTAPTPPGPCAWKATTSRPKTEVV